MLTVVGGRGKRRAMSNSDESLFKIHTVMKMRLFLQLFAIAAFTLQISNCNRRKSSSSPSINAQAILTQGQEVLDSLVANRQSNGIATVDFKAKGVQLSLVVFPNAWSELSVSDQNSLAALVENKARGRFWRIFEGARVVRERS